MDGNEPTCADDELVSFFTDRTLSERQAQVLVCMSEHVDQYATDTEAREATGDVLGISPKTVDKHYRRALAKLTEYMETLDAIESGLPEIAGRVEGDSPTFGDLGK